jgi:hypothetical protein
MSLSTLHRIVLNANTLRTSGVVEQQNMYTQLYAQWLPACVSNQLLAVFMLTPTMASFVMTDAASVMLVMAELTTLIVRIHQFMVWFLCCYYD